MLIFGVFENAARSTTFCNLVSWFLGNVLKKITFQMTLKKILSWIYRFNLSQIRSMRKNWVKNDYRDKNCNGYYSYCLVKGTYNFFCDKQCTWSSAICKIIHSYKWGFPFSRFHHTTFSTKFHSLFAYSGLV